jgi:glycosyltransferase involved in cell wall biosynthesis
VGLKVPPEKIFVAAHALDNSRYNRPVSEGKKAALRAKLGLESEKIALYLGRLEEEKGVEYLIRAFGGSNPKNATLVVVGDGSLREKLQSLVVEQRIQEKTRFVGYVSPEDALIYYAIADLFVLPSVSMPTGKEPWGLVVNEAMNQGLPVVATEAVGAAAGGLVQPGVNGFIVPERDSLSLARAINRLLADDTLRHELSENARRTVAAWDNNRMAKGFQQAIEYVLKAAAC